MILLLVCPGCGRELKVEGELGDPPLAVRCELDCPACEHTGGIPEPVFFDATGAETFGGLAGWCELCDDVHEPSAWPP